MVFSKTIHYRGYLGKIWRNPKFRDCHLILDNYRNWLLKYFRFILTPLDLRKNENFPLNWKTEAQQNWKPFSVCSGYVIGHEMSLKLSEDMSKKSKAENKRERKRNPMNCVAKWQGWRRTNAWNVSFRIFLPSLRWPIHIINPVDKTKLSRYTSHRRNTTVSIETYPLFKDVFWASYQQGKRVRSGDKSTGRGSGRLLLNIRYNNPKTNLRVLKQAIWILIIIYNICKTRALVFEYLAIQLFN